MGNNLYISGMEYFQRGESPKSILKLGKSTPADYCQIPWSSRFNKSESETVITNVMIILKRNGNKWGPIDWKEYKKGRQKDLNFTDSEKVYFDEVHRYCFSAKNASLVSANWKKIFYKFNE